MGEDDEIDVSIIIPTKDEEEGIGECIKRAKAFLKEQNLRGEIIVSDNSTDSTPEIARKLGAKVVTPDKKGYGYAYIYAFRHAKGKYIIMGDGDGTYDFTEASKLLEPLVKDKADLVVGSRFKGKIIPGAMPFLHRYIGNPILTRLMNFFFKLGISDAHSGFRAIKKESLKKLDLKGHGMEFASEMLINAKRKGLRIEEVPITYYPRKGCSKIRSFSDGWRHLKLMLLHTPTWLFLVPSMLLLGIGLMLMITFFLSIRILGFLPGEYSAVLSSLMLLSGFQVFYLGIFSKTYALKRGVYKSRLIKFLIRYFTLERGILLGIGVITGGIIYASYLAYMWLAKGYKSLPFKGEYMLGFTLMVLGIQIIFSSFMLSMLIEVK